VQRGIIHMVCCALATVRMEWVILVCLVPRNTMEDTENQSLVHVEWWEVDFFATSLANKGSKVLVQPAWVRHVLLGIKSVDLHYA
jgi:hypothetical protein